MAKKRHTGAFVLGSLIGGLAGAALTLWKTPKSGAELRASLSGGGPEGSRTLSTGDTTTAATEERSFSNPVLSFVEKVVAPIPGVELGKLARDDPQAAAAPVRASAADARPPESTFDPVEPEHGVAMAATDTAGTVEEPPVAPAETATGAGDTVVYRSGASTSDEAPVAPAEEVTREATAGSEAPAATTEDLTSPTPEYAEQLEEERAADSTERATDLAEAGAPGYEAVSPEEEVTHDPVEGSEAHAATTEDLTSPTPEYTEQLEEEQPADPTEGGNVQFPESPARDEPR